MPQASGSAWAAGLSWASSAGSCFAALLIVLLAQFAGAFLDALRGHDARLVEIGSAWGFGSTTKSVQAASSCYSVG